MWVGESRIVDGQSSRWILKWLRPWLAKRWVKAILVLVLFAVVGLILMFAAERKDSGYWAGYTNGQRWVHEGGYRAHEESITAYCRAQAAAQPARTFEHGCVDGARNAMK